MDITGTKLAMAASATALIGLGAALAAHAIDYNQQSGGLSYAITIAANTDISSRINPENVRPVPHYWYNEYHCSATERTRRNAQGQDVEYCSYFRQLSTDRSFGWQIPRCEQWWLFRSDCAYVSTTLPLFKLPEVRRALRELANDACASQALTLYDRSTFAYKLRPGLGCEGGRTRALTIIVMVMPEDTQRIAQRAVAQGGDSERQLMQANTANSQICVEYPDSDASFEPDCAPFDR